MYVWIFFFVTKRKLPLKNVVLQLQLLELGWKAEEEEGYRTVEYSNQYRAGVPCAAVALVSACGSSGRWKPQCCVAAVPRPCTVGPWRRAAPVRAAFVPQFVADAGARGT